MTMSVDGLVSGMDTTSLIAQLLRAEGAPQTRLKTTLTAVQAEASAYRAVNTAFAAIRSAAEALTTTSLAAARTANSSTEHVTASAGATAVDGSSVTFSVANLARSQQQASTTTWTAANVPWADQDASRRLEFRDADGAVVEDLTIPPGATLTQVAALINGSKAGVRATIIRPEGGRYQLLIASEGSGTDGKRDVVGFDADDVEVPGAFFETRPAEDALLDLGGGLTATSSTNTFADLLSGVSVTVSEADTDPTTITVGQDVDSVATKFQSLVDAVNAALTSVKTQTSNATGANGALKGDFALTSLAGSLLGAVSGAVGDKGSPAQIGLELTRDGKITFDKTKFTAALEGNPDLAQAIVGGIAAADTDDGVAVRGVAQRLLDVAKAASDSTTGSIVSLAKGKDSIAEDIKDRIEAWDLRLALRRDTLTRQFTAMETALSSLRNQSTWLAGQVNSLPS